MATYFDLQLASTNYRTGHNQIVSGVPVALAVMKVFDLV
jgi:hypothetical protein